MKRFLIVVAYFSLIFFGVKVFAQETQISSDRSYSYPIIDFSFLINEDSTIDVEEQETFQFNGGYHEGWRSLSLNKIDAITDIFVIDGETNLPLEKVNSELDKYDPNSWGKYTVISKNGNKNIIWYFNEKDNSHTWIIRYKLHGAISFLKEYDEFYWNLLTDFSEPINYVSASVLLPKDSIKEHVFSAYRNNSNLLMGKDRVDSRTFDFFFNDVQSNEDITIAPAWDKGIVSHRAYWFDFFKVYIWVVLSFIFLLFSIFFALIRWYVLEKKPIQDKSIVPEYEPPEKLPPAMAEVIMKESISSKTWPATIVDLACRGYLTIREEPLTFFKRIMNSPIYSRFLKPIIRVGFFVAFLFLVSRDLSSSLVVIFGILLIFFLFMSILSKNKEYTLVKKYKEVNDLLPYEQRYLDTIFKYGEEFSTLEMKKAKNRIKAQELYKEVVQIENLLYKDTQNKTNAYVKPPISFKFIIFLIIFFSIAVNFLNTILNSTQITCIVISSIAIIVIIFAIKNPYLNAKGQKLKTDWLGFKMYLESAEKYRMQNLTPDTFEKYLPYAMILGVEKKWAKAFESMHIPQPSWYIGTTAMYASSNNFSGPFSPSSFASSFSSSFASSFSSSGGGGGAGGGGSAGGGGGGGGGGAS